MHLNINWGNECGACVALESGAYQYVGLCLSNLALPLNSSINTHFLKQISSIYHTCSFGGIWFVMLCLFSLKRIKTGNLLENILTL